MKKVDKLIVFLLFLVILPITVSCRRTELSVSQVMVQPYVNIDEREGLSVYFRSNIDSPEKANIIITDPSGNLSWNMRLSEVEYNGVKYYGSSDITMPSGSYLPEGMWQLELVYKDGRTVKQSFNVSYGDVHEALQRNPFPFDPVYDVPTNWTVLF